MNSTASERERSAAQLDSGRHHGKLTGSQYSVVIRTFNSALTLPGTLAFLAFQTQPPVQLIFVDAGSTDGTIMMFPPNAIHHRYEGTTFNYSDALNQGVRYVDTEYVAFVSSHSSLQNNFSMEYAVTSLDRDPSLAGAWFSPYFDRSLGHELVDRSNFNGFNGLSNTCSIVRTTLVRERPFRPEVFSAEDQEWASWAISEQHLKTACVIGSGCVNRNPRMQSFKKRLNEQVSVAYFTKPELLAWTNIGRHVTQAVLPSSRPFDIRERVFSSTLALRLAWCRFRGLRGQSRYF